MADAGGVSMLNLAAAAPELLLAIGAMALLMAGAFQLLSDRLIANAAIALIVVAAAAALFGGGGDPASGPAQAFSGAFVVDNLAVFAKVLALIGAALTLIMARSASESEKLDRFEFPVLATLATLGMCMMISANDFISLYMGLELQSLALYVIAAFKRSSVRATEAGLKYFILGALSSGMLLYGVALVYGFTGATRFDAVAAALSGGEAGVGMVFGLVFIIAGLAFKVSAAPFHMWTPDVYEGAPTPVTAFFAAAPKIAALALFARVMMGPFAEIASEWRQVISFVAMASMIIGAFGAIAQTNLKRLMAYSSIGHMGFALVGLAAGSQSGVEGVMIYMPIYMSMSLGVFAMVLSMRRSGVLVEQISDLSGLSQTRPVAALCLGVLMFSLAGIPPTAGFLGKLYVFRAAVEMGLWPLAVIGVLSSVVGCFYYLRVVKLMYVDPPGDPLDSTTPSAQGAILTIAALIAALTFFYPQPIMGPATAAAASLFGGA